MNPVVDIEPAEEGGTPVVNATWLIQENQPGAVIDGFTIEEQVKGTEIIIGMSRDPGFGPLMMVGMGGIWNARDALEFLVCGASAIQIGTANFVHPNTATEVIDGIASWCAEQGIARVSEIIATLKH